MLLLTQTARPGHAQLATLAGLLMQQAGAEFITPGLFHVFDVPVPSGEQVGIVATSEEAQRAPGGLRLPPKGFYAALPHGSAMGRLIAVSLADGAGRRTGPEVWVPVRDIGPWRTDDCYWVGKRRPAAEALRGKTVRWDAGRKGWFDLARKRRGRHKVCNGAGLDLSAAVWRALRPGLTWSQALSQRETVNWRFASFESTVAD